MRFSIVLRLTFFLFLLAMLPALPVIAQLNISCSVPGTLLVTDANGDTLLPQHDIQTVSVAEPLFSDGSQKLAFTLKVQRLSPLPVASWNIIFTGPDNVPRFLQMSTLLGNTPIQIRNRFELAWNPCF